MTDKIKKDVGLIICDCGGTLGERIDFEKVKSLMKGNIFVDLRNVYDPETIRKEGLKLSMAKGNTYGEPNMVWASSVPMTDSKNVVEFSTPSDDPSMVLERPSKGQTPEDWMSGNHHVGFTRDIKPEEILAIHEPWHKVYRYIKNNHGIINDIVNGELDDLDENNYADEFKAIREVKKELGHSTGTGAN
jgi:hypothetical protein